MAVKLVTSNLLFKAFKGFIGTRNKNKIIFEFL